MEAWAFQLAEASGPELISLGFNFNLSGNLIDGPETGERMFIGYAKPVDE